CARVLLPGADVDDRGLHARLDRLERRIGVTVSSATPINPGPPPSQTPPQPETASVPATPEPVVSAHSAAETQPGQTKATVPQLSITDVRRLWPEVLEEVKGKRRFTWILLSQNAQVTELRNGTLLLAMSNAGARDSFARGGNEDVLREAIVVVIGADFAIETMVDPSASASAEASRTPQSSRAPAAGPPAVDPSATRATNGAQNAIAEDPDEAASRDDSDLKEDPESHAELLARHLGAEIIAEEDHGA
ncbi:MAG TPA: hypothetical protein VFY56_12875, partial [Propionibacteriaceae bacterium]|nr:hypothetical protein [Propionibacteriaceae bacterium]